MRRCGRYRVHVCDSQGGKTLTLVLEDVAIGVDQDQDKRFAFLATCLLLPALPGLSHLLIVTSETLELAQKMLKLGQDVRKGIVLSIVSQLLCSGVKFLLAEHSWPSRLANGTTQKTAPQGDYPTIGVPRCVREVTAS
jgi:hypothetical protein